MSEYITKATFYKGKGKGRKAMPSGKGVTLKQLGINQEEADRYVSLGLMAVKGEPAPAQDSGPSTEVVEQLDEALADNVAAQKVNEDLQADNDALKAELEALKKQNAPQQ